MIVQKGVMCYNKNMENVVLVKNRKGLNLSIKLNVEKNRDKLAFLLHGLGARKDYPHMVVMEKTFAEHGYNVVNIDATNSNNDSDKSVDGITFTGHYNDLEDVIEWAKTQPFFKHPFTLAGQSMGAVACVLYASKFPNDVQSLLTANFSWIDGKIESQNNRRRDIILKQGHYEQVSKSTGKAFKIGKNYLDDLENYDLSTCVDKITADTILVVGMADSQYHIQNNEILFKNLKCRKQMIKLDGVPHDLANTPEDRAKFESAMQKCLEVFDDSK